MPRGREGRCALPLQVGREMRGIHTGLSYRTEHTCRLRTVIGCGALHGGRIGQRLQRGFGQCVHRLRCTYSVGDAVGSLVPVLANSKRCCVSKPCQRLECCKPR